MAFSDLEILARVIQCEAGGEGDNGMRAVACVVMNRVQVTYGEYGRFDTIRTVVYQPGQFDCVREEIRGSYIPRIFIICGRSRFITILPIGRLRGTGLPIWVILFGISIRFSQAAGSFFRLLWGSLSYASGITAFIIRPRLTLKPRRLFCNKKGEL